MSTDNISALPEEGLRKIYARHELADAGLVMSDLKLIASEVLALSATVAPLSTAPTQPEQPSAERGGDAELSRLVAVMYNKAYRAGTVAVRRSSTEPEYKKVHDEADAALVAVRAALASRPAPYPLPDDLFDSKDWRAADYAGRVEYLHTMLQAKNRELDTFLEMASCPAEQVTDDDIRRVFLANGFTVKDGQTDLKPYVFDAAYALLGITAAPNAGGEGK